MIKESERKRAYRPRAAHKEGCLCAPCKQKRGVGKVNLPLELETISQEIPSTPPAEIALGSLGTKALFEYNGLRYRVGETTPEVTICQQLTWLDNGPDSFWQVKKVISFGLAIMVKPIK